MTGRMSTLAMMVMLGVSTGGLAGGRPAASTALGYVAARGEVWVSGARALGGTAVFAGDEIRTGRGSSVELNLRSGERATLGENGVLAVERDAAGEALRLGQGLVTVRGGAGEPARVRVRQAMILIAGAKGDPALCEIAALGETTRIRAERGRIEVRGRGKPQFLLPGRSLRLEAGVPQAAGTPAGKVSNAIPDETVQRSGQKEQPLKVNDGVLWEDTVQTLNTGRVRIALEDGSTLNIGARSMMRITKHDAASQQTAIELQLGKLRGQVVKLSKPGASFQVKTNTAVIGVVGTILVIEALANNTHVRCLEGLVRVTNVNPAIAGETTLHAGEQTDVQAGQAPGAAAPSPPADVANDLNATNAGEPPPPETMKFGEFRHFERATGPSGTTGTTGAQGAAAGGGQATGTGVSGGLTGLNAVGAAAAGVSTGLAGAGVVKAGSARDAAQGAQNSANQAQGAAEGAAGNASNAGNAATAFGNGVDTFIQQISPGGPGCGCLP